MEPYPQAAAVTDRQREDETWETMVAALDLAIELAEELHERWPSSWMAEPATIAHSNLMSRLAERYVVTPTPERVKELARMPYAEYLQTEEWRSRRQLARQVHMWCQLCGSMKGPFHTHHQTYENRGEEDWSELTLLCSGCHRRHHGR